jgi:hypothetical protein
LLDKQRIPLNASLAFNLVPAILLLILLNLGAMEAEILICPQVMEDFVDRE